MEPTRVLPRARLLGCETSEPRTCREATPNPTVERRAAGARRCTMHISCSLMARCQLVRGNDRRRTTRGVIAAIPLPTSPSEIVASSCEGDCVGIGGIADETTRWFVAWIDPMSTSQLACATAEVRPVLGNPKQGCDGHASANAHLRERSVDCHWVHYCVSAVVQVACVVRPRFTTQTLEGRGRNLARI